MIIIEVSVASEVTASNVSFPIFNNQPINASWNFFLFVFQAGQQQASVAASGDSFMKREMPRALEPLVTSSQLIQEAAELIKADGRSAIGRQKLIDACRSWFSTFSFL